DTADSALMSGAYGWAFRDPVRKRRYNLAITAASVLLAFGIGGIEALSLMGDQMGLQGALWRGADLLGADLAKAGIAMVVLCLGGWLVSARLYRRRIAARG
ncbi:HoxN/HupN/NixA family nickel/cobalt transporter, partial [Thioclava sp. BHET1]